MSWLWRNHDTFLDKMSWFENRILSGILIFVVPTMTLFQNFEKLEIVLSTDIVNLASHDGSIMRRKVSQNLGNAW